MATATMEFERPIAELERQIEELKKMAGERSLDVADEIARSRRNSSSCGMRSIAA